MKELDNIRHEEERLQNVIDEVNQGLLDREAIEAISESVDHIADEILALYAHSEGKRFVFVVGGKSRRLTEALLQMVAERFPDGHEAKKAVEQRVRLDDVENKNLYGEGISIQHDRKDSDTSPLEPLSDENVELIICDDAMQTGRKVFHTLHALDKRKMKARYIVFTGPEQFAEGSDYLRPDSWENYKDRVMVGSRNQQAFKVVKGLSSLLSRYANLRLHGNVRSLGTSIPASIDSLDARMATVMRESTRLMKKLKTAMSSHA